MVRTWVRNQLITTRLPASGNNIDVALPPLDDRGKATGPHPAASALCTLRRPTDITVFAQVSCLRSSLAPTLTNASAMSHAVTAAGRTHLDVMVLGGPA